MRADIGSWVAAAASFAAALVAGLEFRRLRLHEHRSEQAVTRGVAVSWIPDVALHVAESDGSATWRYSFVAHNPGVLPIRDVVVTIRFPTPTRRVHDRGHGRPQVEAETESLVLRTPVLLGGRERTWHRTIRMPFAAQDRLPETTADIAFVDMAGEPHVNRWSASLSQVPPTAYPVSDGHGPAGCP